MKLFLPKLLLVAVMATFADAQDVNQSPTVITEAGYYWGNSLVLEGDVVIQGVTDPDAYDGGAIIWNTETGEAFMSGRGKLSSQSSGAYWSLQIGGGSEVCRIGSEVELESVDISFDGNFASSILCIDGNLSDFEICGYAESVIDLSKAKLMGKQEYDIDAGNTLVINELEVKEGVFVEVSGYGAEGYATLQGNLVMNGVLPAFAGEERFECRSVDWEERMQPYGAVQFWVSRGENEEPEPFVPLSVSGTITIKSGTAVVFANEGDFIIGEDNRVSWKSDYRLPTTTDVLFVCSGVDEDSLSLLKPYAYCEDSWAEYSDGGEVTGGYEYIKPVVDRAFYARAGEDGRVYIYLGDVSNDSEGETPIEPSVPALGSVVLTPFVQDAIRGKNIVLEGDCTIPDNLYINWVGTDVSASYEMTGNGTVSTWLFQICSESDTATTYTIGNGISFDGVELAFDANSQSLLKMNGTLKDSTLLVWKGTADISNATVTGSTCYQISRDAAIACNTLTVKQDVALRNYDSYPESAASAYATIKGNLELNGVLSMTTTEQQSEYDAGGWVSGLHSGGYVQFWTGTETISPLNVTGAISIKSDTAIVFSNDGEYRLPGTDDAVFICSSVDQDSLSMLQAYAHRQEDSDYAYTKLVTDREFYAQTGSDGKVYIYLGDGSENSPSIPTPPSKPAGPIAVKPGQTLVLGSTETSIPSVQNPVQMQGGVADASGLEASLLSNKVITGDSGTLLTGDNQTMQLTGGGQVGYSVVGFEGSLHGADLEISSSSNLTLAGEKYDAACIKVQKGTVTISSGSTIGTGTDGDVLDLSSKAVSATNFGTIAADVEIANESTMLNRGTVKGDVSLQGKSTALVNNGSVEGLVTVGSGALLSGSGAAGALILESGASLNVGNSPGYQKYGNLSLYRGSALTFTVDGVRAATLNNAGSGTHSVLIADNLTIAPGSGAVTINVEVTMGIVNAGFDPVAVTLASVGDGNAVAADFTINLNDNNLLEDGAEVTWDAATQSLTLKGTVSKAALAALMDSNSSNVANTMWASASAAQEMARTAEHQFLVGMPGQTTFWGAGVGSFMNVSGDQGFTSNFGGYAVGMQHAFTEKFRAGLSFGQMFGDFKSDDDQLKMEQTAMLPTLTAQYVTPLSKTSSLSVSGHFTYGVVENEADTCQAGTTGKAEWDDEVLNLGLRVAWNKQLGENVSASFYTGLTYQQVEQDSFTEEFTGGEREYRSGSMSSLSLPLGMTLRGIYQMEGTNVFAPELTLAYTGDIARENPEVKTSVYGFNRTGKGTNVGRSAFMLNVGANWMFDSTWSVGAFYTLEARSKQVNQSVNAALRCCF